MWNLIAPNRYLENKRIQGEYRRHRKSLIDIKSQLDITAPQHYEFLNNKPKTKQLAKGKHQKRQSINSKYSLKTLIS